eukprot:Colp12_sorted_trinity150504_noHs@29388
MAADPTLIPLEGLPQWFLNVVHTPFHNVIAASFVFTAITYFVSSRILCPALSKTYRDLSEEKKVDWNSRVASSIHATVVGLACLYVLYYDVHAAENPYTNLSWIARFFMAISVGYLGFDFLLILFNFKAFGNLSLNLQTLGHHVVAASGFYWSIDYQVFQYFCAYRLMSEVSTPFVNLRWYLAVNPKWKNSHLYLINGVVLMLIFFACRIVAIPFFYHRWYVTFDGIYGVPWWLRIVFTYTAFFLDGLNLFWFNKLVTGVMKMLKDQNKDRSKEEEYDSVGATVNKKKQK